MYTHTYIRRRRREAFESSPDFARLLEEEYIRSYNSISNAADYTIIQLVIIQLCIYIYIYIIESLQFYIYNTSGAECTLFVILSTTNDNLC